MPIKKKCRHCEKPSIPGLIKSVGLCQYHYNVLMFGKEWADRCLNARTAANGSKSEPTGSNPKEAEEAPP